jgi:hypothetical protein
MKVRGRMFDDEFGFGWFDWRERDGVERSGKGGMGMNMGMGNWGTGETMCESSCRSI